MKSILISIKPKYVADILNGEKTIEIRKTMPKCDLPIDVYIYCTKGKYEMGKFNSDKKYHEIRDDCCYAGGWLRGLPDEIVNGKVVAKFTLNKVEETDHIVAEELLKSSCLTFEELANYVFNKKTSYAWHIDNLEIFDRPKELSEFRHYKRFDCYNADFDYTTIEYRKIELTKAPQNFCYVEV